MRLLFAAPRAIRTAGRPAGRVLSALALLGGAALSAPALADDGPADADTTAAETAAVETDAAATAEGVVTLTDVPRTPRRVTADAAVRPAGLLGHAACDAGCADICDLPAGPSCGPPCGTTCDGAACGGACGGCGPDLICGDACGPACGLLSGRGVCLPGFGPGVCGPGGCPPGYCPPGYCPPGVPCPGACLLGGGLPLPCPSVLVPGLFPGVAPHLLSRCGGPTNCYLCSLSAIGANANNGRDGLHGKYEHVYALDPSYVDRRTGKVWASQQTGVPMAVPLAPNVRHTMEYGWGMPSSRLVPISRPGPPSWLYGAPAGVQTELPNTRPNHHGDLPYLPQKGQDAFYRTGTGFPRSPDLR